MASTIEKFAFQNQRNGERTQENRSSYLRKGIAGDWRNHFTPLASEAFATACGDMLIAAGYENDHMWVSAADRMAA
jgi:hypothetical protein